MAAKKNVKRKTKKPTTSKQGDITYKVGDRVCVNGVYMTVGYVNAGMAWAGEEEHMLTECLDKNGKDRKGNTFSVKITIDRNGCGAV